MKDESRGLLYQISLLAHKYVMARTKHLTSLRDSTDYAPQPSARPKDISKNIKTPSVLPLYEMRQHAWLPSGKPSFVPSFAKDYARIVHSPSFRRLQGKTQLIPAGENEFFRTRLTHSLEVADIATRIARKLNREVDYFERNPINCELVSCAALLHDIGHPPFGHSGGDVLNQKMEHFGGFEGNAQTLRIVTHSENRLDNEAEVDKIIKSPKGLNLTVGTLAAILKYDEKSSGPILDGNKLSVKKGYYPTEGHTVSFLHEILRVDKEVRLFSIECQIMDLADDIAYSAYDLEDTLEAGIVSPLDLMSIEDNTIAMIRNDVQKGLAKREPHAEVTASTIFEHLSGVFGTLLDWGGQDREYSLDQKRVDRLAFVGRTYAESLQHGKNPLVRRQYLETLIEQNIDAVYVDFNEAVPFLSTLKVDRERLILIESMKAFNFHKVISSRRLQLQHARNRKILGYIFDAFANDDRFTLFSDFQRERLQECDGDDQRKMRLISDIVSSFTDVEALNLYDQLNSTRNGRFWSYAR